MKHVLLFFSSLIFFLFCSNIGFCQDYLILKNKKKVIGKITVIRLQTGIRWAKIKCKDKTYNIRRVLSFVYNDEYYGNIRNQVFAKAAIRGKINLFSYRVFRVYGGFGVQVDSFNSHYDYAIQQGELGGIIKLSYSSLRGMVSDNDSVQNELKKVGRQKFAIVSSMYKADRKYEEYKDMLIPIVEMYNAQSVR